MLIKNKDNGMAKLTQWELENKLDNAVNAEDIDSVKEMFELNPDLDYVHPLFISSVAMKGNIELLKLLSDNNVDLHADGDLAMVMAASKGQDKTVQYLLDDGANIHENGGHALFKTIENNHLSTFELLLKNGADIHHNNDEPIKTTTYGNHQEILQSMIFNHNIEVGNDTMEWLKENKCEEVLNMLAKRDLKDKLSIDLDMKPQSNIQRKQTVKLKI